jgi:nicotinamide-nucleotide amidase
VNIGNFQESPDIVIKQIGDFCLKKSWQLVTAESCTGGGIAYQLTSLPGSSNWFDRGFVTYSNLSKIELLGVQASSIQQYGAVSQEVVMEMAEGAIHKSKAQVSLAVTGIAGPDSSGSQQTVGTCWFGWSSPFFKTHSEKKCFEGNRSTVREQATHFALIELLKLLLIY